MAALTNNVVLKPGAGWQALTSANITSFLRLSKFPKNSVVFIAVGATPPSTTTGGYRMEECTTHFDGAITGNVYARIQNNANDEVIVSVFAN